MSTLINQIHPLLTLIETNKLFTGLYAGILLFVGYFVSKKLSLLAEKASKKHLSRHQTLLIKRASFYGIFALFFISSLQHLGFKLSVLLGAAGVFTVAISFASQTAVSNLISGIFLLFERPFKVGDSVIVNGINGVVESIDLLSTKLITSDNTLVRVPNESMIKSDITNLSYFATRRINIRLGIAYETDLTHVKSIIMQVANACEHILRDPAPAVTINNFAKSAIELKLTAWVKTSKASLAKNSLRESIKMQFDQEGIKNVSEVTP
jgi:small-conductance mechanosensitive channel